MEENTKASSWSVTKDLNSEKMSMIKFRLFCFYTVASTYTKETNYYINTGLDIFRVAEKKLLPSLTLKKNI